MRILVLGGSYFFGKCFVKLAAKTHEVVMLNRGTRMFHPENVTLLTGERHDRAALASAKGHFDAVVDFCAYAPKDIEIVCEALTGRFKQYIFISTCDVYERGLGKALDESAPFEYRMFGGEAGEYIAGKVRLEEELQRLANTQGFAWTSIRPAFLYGPGNYAPREGIYFRWINQTGQILHPSDADGEFQMVYVEDAARAVLHACGNRVAFEQAYNLAPFPMVTYESFADALSAVSGTPFERILVTVEQIAEKNIPLPFPLTKVESNCYDASKSLSLLGDYTPLEQGLLATWQAWLDEQKEK